jgi:hypothetical protein
LVDHSNLRLKIIKLVAYFILISFYRNIIILGPKIARMTRVERRQVIFYFRRFDCNQLKNLQQTQDPTQYQLMLLKDYLRHDLNIRLLKAFS